MKLNFRMPKHCFYLLVLLVFIGCKDDDEDREQVPVIATDIILNLNLPEYNVLQNPGGYLNLTGGSRGIIVYRVSPDEFSAFDRHCTFNVDAACRVNVDEDTGLTAVDEECCGSEFELINGGVVGGPAQRSLLPYQTIYNSNTNVLRITN